MRFPLQSIFPLAKTVTLFNVRSFLYLSHCSPLFSLMFSFVGRCLCCRTKSNYFQFKLKLVSVLENIFAIDFSIGRAKDVRTKENQTDRQRVLQKKERMKWIDKDWHGHESVSRYHLWPQLKLPILNAFWLNRRCISDRFHCGIIQLNDARMQ